MLSIAGMAYQAALTGNYYSHHFIIYKFCLINHIIIGQGTLEQLASGHISPFGDGQGVF